MNTEKARFNMIEQQIRTWDVLDEGVLEAASTVPREFFVPDEYKNMAFADMVIPIGYEQIMLPPKEQLRIVQSAALQKSDRVLEVGTGTGYLTAIISHLCHQVETIDCFDDFTLAADKRFDNLGLSNIHIKTTDFFDMPTATTKYDVIIFTSSTHQVPGKALDMLAESGRLIAIIGDNTPHNVVCITKDAEGGLTQVGLFETQVPVLRNAPAPNRFTF